MYTSDVYLLLYVYYTYLNLLRGLGGRLVVSEAWPSLCYIQEQLNVRSRGSRPGLATYPPVTLGHFTFTSLCVLICKMGI